MATGVIVPIINQAFDGLTKIIGEFHISPEEKQQAAQALAAAQAQAQQSAVDYDVKMNDIAGQNIRSDAATGDKYTQRARPNFMYVVELILAFNYIVIPLVQACTGKALAPMVLPADLLTLFGVCVTGYVFNRTAEKVAAMPGDSQVSILGLTKISNKS
jgi:hypothetical protein